MRKPLILLVAVLTMVLGHQLPAQRPFPAPPPETQGPSVDSLLMEYSDFLDQVLNNHPIAVQADLQPQMGDANLRTARGAFDPKLGSGLSQKSFDGKNYFRVLDAGVKVPIWGGVTLYGDYQQANGEYLNPEYTLPDAGLVSAGIEVNLGNGLMIDKRRADLKKARFYAQATEAQRTIMLNDLIFDATQHYWIWVRYYNEMLVYREAVELASVRLEGVISSFKNGDKPAIDTTEALIQYQNRLYSLTESMMKVNSSRLALSNFLWGEQEEPLELRETVRAPKVKIKTHKHPELEEQGQKLFNPSSLTESHPVLNYYSLQLDMLEVERRYKLEQLKPKASVKYNILSGVEEERFNPLLQNYKWGFAVSFPLFLRKERGELEKVKLQQQQSQLDLNLKWVQLENKLKDLAIKIDLTADQIELYTDAVENYQRLLDGEVRKFESGESSLFLVNRREQSLIKAELQLLSQLTNYPILVTDYGRTAGRLLDE